MNQILSWRQLLVIFGIPGSMILFLAALSLTFDHPEIVSLGILADLVVTIPLVYILLIWNKNIPKYTVVPVFLAGILIAGWILPHDQHFYLDGVKKWMVPAVELTVILFIIRKVRLAVQSYRKHQNHSPDFFSVVSQVAREILPPGISEAFATEIAVFYYALFSWKKRPFKSNEFTYHRQSGTPVLLYMLIFLVLAETLIVHLLIYSWNPPIAWGLTLISFYTAIQLVGFARSMTKRPISIEGGHLLLRYGILAECTLLLENIESIEFTSKPVSFDKATRRLSPLGELDTYNVIIHLKRNATLISLYGFKKRFRHLAVHIDEKEAFHRLLCGSSSQEE